MADPSKSDIQSTRDPLNDYTWSMTSQAHQQRIISQHYIKKDILGLI